MAFEAVLARDRLVAGPARRLMIAVSLALHGVALAIGVAYSFWHVDELPLPTVAVTLTGGAPPPPPPPPPARRHTSTPRTKPVETRPQTLVQPDEQPKEKPKPPPADEDEGSDDGEEGGVAGGVKGGVVGGVVGASLTSAGPKLLPPLLGGKQLLIDPNSEPYKIRLPPPLQREGMAFFAVLRVCVSAAGDVTDVKILRGADPAIDPQIPSVVRRWRYRPYSLDGRPIPFCYMLRYEISAR